MDKSFPGEYPFGMKKRWHWSLWTGFLLVLAAFFLMPVVAHHPATRDYAWPCMALVMAGAALIFISMVKAWARPDVYRGKILATSLGILSMIAAAFFVAGIFYFGRVPDSAGVLRLSEKAPGFELKDQDGKPVTLGDLVSNPGPENTFAKPKGVLLMFYRGHW